MDHQEYCRIVPGAKCAFLFLHGIVSTPRHFDAFIELVPKDISIRALLLDGHGKSVRDFGRSSMEKWEAQVQQAIDDLCEHHEQIYLVAHSMGTLFSICHAAKNQKIAGLFLLASPLKVFVRPRMFVSTAQIYFDRIHPRDEVAQAMRDDLSVQISKNPFHYIRWIPRFLELFGKIYRTRKEIGKLQIPVYAYPSVKDELVSIKSVKYLKRNPNIRIIPLPNSLHSYYDKQDMALLLEEFQAFLDKWGLPSSNR